MIDSWDLIKPHDFFSNLSGDLGINLYNRLVSVEPSGSPSTLGYRFGSFHLIYRGVGILFNLSCKTIGCIPLPFC